MEIIEVKNTKASAKIALQGAHIFDFSLHKREPLLWLSSLSDFKKGKAIRGGVPICWPSFGMNNPNLAQHGFARVSLFEHIKTIPLDKSTTQVVLRLKDSKESLKLWAYKFELEVKITISEYLKIELITTNMDTKPFEITQALHTYFNISDIKDVKISGLNNKPYLNALSSKKYLQDGAISFNQEIDRVYQDVDKEIVLSDKNRSVKIVNSGSSSCVIWNPWIEKCKRMSAMQESAYREFVCIESANAYEDSILLKPNERHSLSATINSEEYIPLN